jgi:hypothetical protein
VAIIVIMIALVSAGLFFLSRPNNNGSVTTNPPDYLLDETQKQEIQKIVENFVILYNSYSYKNYDNMYSLYDSQISEMQAQIDKRAAELDSSLAPGYNQEATIKPGSFKYSYPKSNQILASVQVDITSNVATKRTITASVELVKEYDSWSIKNIKIEP